MDIALSVLTRKHCSIVWAVGQCNAANAVRLRERLLEVLAASSARMILDLSGLALLDGAGIDALAAVGRQARLLGGAVVITAGPSLHPEDLREQ